MIWTVLGTIGVVLATVIAGILADRRWGIVPRKERLSPAPRPALPAHEPGEAPATALRLTPDQLELLRRSRRCCGQFMESLPDAEVAFGGGVIAILHFRCARCAATRSIYVQRLVE